MKKRNSAGGSPPAQAERVWELQPGDPRWPKLWSAIMDPPPHIWGTGDADCLTRDAIAIVGTRRATHRGRTVAAGLAERLACLGWVVVSGLATGIDGAAHRGALRGGGRTVGVMGTGVDRTYPSRHAALRREVEASGCAVTEEDPGTPPLPYNFPRRNRLISGLARAVVVIEAPLRSGALHTAVQAADQGREVFAVPGPIDCDVARGCHKLLKEGAHLLESVHDLVSVVGFPTHDDNAAVDDAARAALDKPRPGSAAAWLWDRLDLTGFRLSELRRRWRGDPATWREGLRALEMAGLIQRLPGGMVARTIWRP